MSIRLRLRCAWLGLRVNWARWRGWRAFRRASIAEARMNWQDGLRRVRRYARSEGPSA